MSKFTKALEKIQLTRSPKNEAKGGPELNTIPAYDLTQEIEMRESVWERGVKRIKNATPDKRVVHYHFPNSVIAEQYRSLRTNLKTRLMEENANVVLVSSSVNGEGKTITSINLAYSLAEATGCRIALVDADLRRGKIASYLSLGKDLLGLSDYLLDDEVNVKDVIIRNSLENLFIIPRGNIVKNPAELVSSEKFRNLVGELKKNFDYVIIDSPPIMSVADAAIFGRETDGLLMVIRSGKTPKTIIAHAHQLFKQAAVKIFGYVLTNVEYQSSDYRYYHYDYYMNDPGEGTVKGKFKLFLKRMGLHFEDHEEKFTNWWDKRFNSKTEDQRSKTVIQTEDKRLKTEDLRDNVGQKKKD